MTHTACIRFAPLFTKERLDSGWCRPGRTMYQALRFWPGEQDVPLLVNHDEDREIGRVHQLVKWDQLDGPWFVARANITEPPDWLDRGTRVSFEYKAPHRSTFIDDWIPGAYVTEVSVLSPSVEPAEPLAQVLLLERSAPAERGLAAGDEIIHTPPGQVVRRYFTPPKITVR